MLVTNKRLSRALQFKQRVDDDGRCIDIASYGTLIEYYSKHNQIGSAVLVLKECVAKHNAVPSEAFLSKLRSLCTNKCIEATVGLSYIMGKDPNQWLRHGQQHLKREDSKKGRKNVRMANNRLLA